MTTLTREWMKRAALLGLLGAAGWYAFSRPAMIALAETNAACAAMVLDADAHAAGAAAAADPVQVAADLRERVALYESWWKEDHSASMKLRSIGELTQRYGVSLHRFEPRGMRERDGVRIAVSSVELRGPFAGVVDVVRSVPRLASGVRIADLRMAPLGDTVRCDIVIHRINRDDVLAALNGDLGASEDRR